MVKHMKKLLSTFLVFCLIITMIPTSAARAAGTSRDTAESFEFGKAYTGTLKDGNDQHWYKFRTPDENNSYFFDLLGLDNAYAAFNLYDDFGSVLAGKEAGKKGDKMEIKLSPATEYYLKVSPGAFGNIKDGDISYKFECSIIPDEPDYKEKAREIKLDTVVKGRLCTKDDVDWYSFTTGKNEYYQASFVGLDNYIKFSILNENDKAVYDDYGVGKSGEEVICNLLPNHKYYIKMNECSEDFSDYSLKIVSLDVTLKWSDAYNVCKIGYVGSNDKNVHGEIDTKVTYNRISSVSCTSNETIRYTAKPGLKYVVSSHNVDVTTKKATGHSFGKEKVTKKATALSKGIASKTCSRCGHVQKRTLAKLKPKLTLSKTNVTLKKGQKITIKASKLAYGDKVKSWKSSNTKIATVKNGKITAKKKGNAKITVTLASGYKKTIKVKVK